jgi:hypothetical protein
VGEGDGLGRSAGRQAAISESKRATARAFPAAEGAFTIVKCKASKRVETPLSGV